MSAVPRHCAVMLEALQFRDSHPEGLLALNEAEWNDLLTRAEYARLMIPLSQTCAKDMPAWVLARVERSVASTAERFERMKRDYLEIAKALRDANAGHLILKGFALCPDFVAHPRFRMQSDIDIFCPPDSIERALEALHSIGYETRNDADYQIGHHLAPLAKKSTWKWRGDLFDPEMPIDLELHFRFSDEIIERFSPRDLEQFWDRRIEQHLDDFYFPTLRPVDHFGYSALHVVRHLFDGAVPTYSVYEIASFLHRNAAREEFWMEWRDLHDDSTRSLESICCKLAQEWFACELPPEVQRQVDALPPAVHAWFRNYARSPLDAWFVPNKDAVWLHAVLLPSSRERWKVVLSTIVPRKLPQYVPSRFDPDGPPETRLLGGWSVAGAKNYLSHGISRVNYHGRALLPTLGHGFRFWWSTKELEPQFWIYFAASLFFNLGMFIFFFLYNLFLLDCGYREKFLGLVTSVSAVGGIIGTIAGGITAQRFGLRRTLLFCFGLLPALSALRILLVSRVPQLGFAFLASVVGTMFAVCYSPALAQVTNVRNRAFVFSFVASTMIGIGFVAGLAGGHLPGWIGRFELSAEPVHLKQVALLIACGITAIALWPMSRLHFSATPAAEKRLYPRSPFLFRFLAAIAVWALVTGSFSPFFNAYFSQYMRMPVQQIGVVFSFSSITQVVAILCTPLIFRRFGLVPGIMYMQIATAISLGLLAAAPGARSAAIIYTGFMAFQWMSEPGMETLLMNEISPSERSGASALNLLVISSVQAVAAVVAGASFARFGYPTVLAATGVLALLAAVSFRFLLGSWSGNAHAGRVPSREIAEATPAPSAD
ncbi:MAG: MFS transporter [Candidatus Acidiferrales bacterium]